MLTADARRKNSGHVAFVSPTRRDVFGIVDRLRDSVESSPPPPLQIWSRVSSPLPLLCPPQKLKVIHSDKEKQKLEFSEKKTIITPYLTAREVYSAGTGYVTPTKLELFRIDFPRILHQPGGIIFFFPNENFFTNNAVPRVLLFFLPFDSLGARSCRDLFEVEFESLARAVRVRTCLGYVKSSIDHTRVEENFIKKYIEKKKIFYA